MLQSTKKQPDPQELKCGVVGGNPKHFPSMDIVAAIPLSGAWEVAMVSKITNKKRPLEDLNESMLEGKGVRPEHFMQSPIPPPTSHSTEIGCNEIYVPSLNHQRDQCQIQ